MAKQQENKDSNIRPTKNFLKLNKYCITISGKGYFEKLFQLEKEFNKKCWEQIKEAEKITGKDYLDIKEKNERDKI